MIVSHVVAIGKHRQIGSDNDLLWKLPEDFKMFKQITMGHYLLMGRKTFESIGRPLPGRKTIVITRNPSFSYPGVDVFATIREGVDHARYHGEKELMVIGGGEIYSQTLEYTDRLHLTVVNYHGQAETYYPNINWNQWRLVGTKELDRAPLEANYFQYDKIV